MESKYFAEGAMRRCFRMLKETQAPNITDQWRSDWRHASAYVAKEYKDAAVGTREAFERDVVMQQEAKLWGARFNALHPPKPVDFLQAFLIEMVDRPGKPVFACECVSGCSEALEVALTRRAHRRRVVTGAYIKHNSNSGYVESHRRATPQTFSHYTFQASRGRLMVVDIQGVSDLYTDPQVHTLEGKGYGEGNLGAGGFALFFAAHRCTPLCARLGLTPLPKSTLEMAREERLAAAPAETRSRSSSGTTSSGTAMVRTWRSAEEHGAAGDGDGVKAALHAARGAMSTSFGSKSARDAARRTWAARESARWIKVVKLHELPPWALQPESWAADVLPVAAELKAERLRRMSMGAIVRGSVDEPRQSTQRDIWAIFAPVHLSLARYNACGGLDVLEDVPDEPSAVFHACYAARGGDLAATRALRDLMRGVVQDLVPGVKLEEERADIAAALTAVLARSGDIGACVEAADGAGGDEKLAWLQRALAGMCMQEDEEAEMPAKHELLEKLGRAHLECGSKVEAAEAFTEASEAAMAAGKAKLSLKLAAMAEECAGEEDEA